MSPSLQDRLEGLIEASGALLDQLQSNHERLVMAEHRARSIEFPDSAEPQIESDATIHSAALLQSAQASPPTVAPSGAAAAEQIVEGMAPGFEWFDELAAQFPGLDPSTLTPAWGIDAANTGALALYRGFRGEQIVGDLLANLGLPTPPGFEGYSFADTTNNPAWDVVLATDEGTVEAQIKIASGARAIRQHLSDHPDVTTVYASTDAAQGMQSVDGVTVIGPGDAWPDTSDAIVVDIGRTSAEVGVDITDALDAQTGLFDDVLEFLPLAGLALVGARAGYRLLDSNDEAADVRARAANEAKDVLINSSAGEIASLLVSDTIGAPVTLATALGRSMVAGVGRSIERSHSASIERGRLLEALGTP